MNYKKAERILPVEVIRLIQNYIDGECIYIPRKKNNRRKWGSKTTIRQELNERNMKIYEEYKTGLKTTEIHKMGYNDVDPAEEAAQKVIAEAKRYLGRHYVYGATGPNSFDCSGFTQYVFLHASSSKGVTISSLSNSYYNAHYGCARRVL